MYIKFSERAGEHYLLKDFLNSDPSSISVFQNYGINYSCNGDKTLKDVCTENGIDMNEVYLKLTEAGKKDSEEIEKFYKWDLRKLTDYLIETHETEIKQGAFSISKNLEKTSTTFGSDFKELKEIESTFTQMLKEILNHINNEEKFLFHVIRYLVDCKKFDEKPRISGFKTVKNPISKMESDHTKSDENLLRIKSLIKELEINNEIPSEIISLIEEIKGFDKKFQFHLHIENNILFPKAIELEIELLKN